MAGKEQQIHYPPKELPKPSRKAIVSVFLASGLLLGGGIYVSQSDRSIPSKETIVDKQTSSPEKSDPKPTPQINDPKPQSVERTVFAPPVLTPGGVGRLFTIAATALVGLFFSVWHMTLRSKRRVIMIQ